MCAVAECSHEAGFSLIEVLCAVAIAAMAIVVLSGGATGSLTASRMLDMNLGARIVVQSILEDELAAAATAPVTRQGNSGPYRWRLDVVREAGGLGGKLPPTAPLYRLTATAAWGRDANVTANVLKFAR